MDEPIPSGISPHEPVRANAAIREQVTKRITYNLAASIIADQSFPSENQLPGFRPPLFNTFGHHVLLDYGLLLTIVWQVVDQVKKTLAEKQESGWGQSTALAAGGVVALVGFVITMAIGQNGLCGGLVALAAGAVTYNIIMQDTSAPQRVADIRAAAIEKLVNGQREFQVDPNLRAKINGALKYVGNGALGGPDVPVLITRSNKHPFPGYGLLQAENLFICRPKAKNNQPLATIPPLPDIRSAIASSIMSTMSRHSVENIECGEVVIVHGSSLAVNSRWLDANKRPRLWVTHKELDNLEAIDEHAAVRTFFAVQVLFPEHMTAATFFVRVFMAGNSASCQVAVTTLGPTILGLDFFMKRLAKYKVEQNTTPVKNAAQKKTVLSAAVRQLNLIDVINQLGGGFKPTSVNKVGVDKLDLFKEDDDEGYPEAFRKVVASSAVWPGQYLNPENYREANSLTFTNNFFGKTEAIASVKTLYDQISRAILDCLDEQGFDVSDYRDNQGNYSINAEKIDQLVVGEQIRIVQTEEEKKKEEAASPAQTGPTKAA